MWNYARDFRPPPRHRAGARRRRDFPAGRDRAGGGTWLGFAPDGARWSCITNVREPESAPENAPSRGALCANFLLGESTPEEAARAAVRDGARYAGFNAVFGSSEDAWHACNRSGVVEMPRGISVVTNAAPGLDAAWPTAERARARFAEALRDAADDALLEALFDVLADGTKLPLSPTRMPPSVAEVDRTLSLMPRSRRERREPRPPIPLAAPVRPAQIIVKIRELNPCGTPVWRVRGWGLSL